MENQSQQQIDTAILEFYKTVDQLDQHQLEDLAKQYGVRLSEANRHWRDYEANSFLMSIVSARVIEFGNSKSTGTFYIDEADAETEADKHSGGIDTGSNV